MSNCCDGEKVNLENGCPGCEKPAVPLETVKAMVNFPLWNIQPGDSFFYNNEPNADYIYFSLKSGMLIEENELREQVFCQHQDDDDCYVCYCFKVKVGDLRAASPEEREQLLQRIMNASQQGQCSCKTHNPKGSCCIGDVKNIIDKFNQQEQ